MKDRIDPGLRTHLDDLQSNELCEAVVSFSTDQGADTVAKAILDRATSTTGVAPESVRLMPLLGVMHVSASSQFLKTLLEDERVSAASRADL